MKTIKTFDDFLLECGKGDKGYNKDEKCCNKCGKKCEECDCKECDCEGCKKEE